MLCRYCCCISVVMEVKAKPARPRMQRGLTGGSSTCRGTSSGLQTGLHQVEITLLYFLQILASPSFLLHQNKRLDVFRLFLQSVQKHLCKLVRNTNRLRYIEDQEVALHIICHLQRDIQSVTFGRLQVLCIIPQDLQLRQGRGHNWLREGSYTRLSATSHLRNAAHIKGLQALLPGTAQNTLMTTPSLLHPASTMTTSCRIQATLS